MVIYSKSGILFWIRLWVIFNLLFCLLQNLPNLRLLSQTKWIIFKPNSSKSSNLFAMVIHGTISYWKMFLKLLLEFLQLQKILRTTAQSEWRWRHVTRCDAFQLIKECSGHWKLKLSSALKNSDVNDLLLPFLNLPHPEHRTPAPWPFYPTLTQEFKSLQVGLSYWWAPSALDGCTSLGWSVVVFVVL